MSNVSDLFEMKVPAKPEYVGVVRLTVSGIANRIGYSYDDIEDIKIAVAEACTNVVDHAYEQGGFMRLACSIHDDRMEIMVSDRGQSFDMESVRKDLGPVDGQKPVRDLQEGGLGLFLIDTLMDKVQISGEAGVVIVMTKFLQRDGVDHDVNRFKAAPDAQKQQ